VIAAGELRHRISVQELSRTPDSLGQLTDTWTTVLDNISCVIEDLSGKQLEAAQAMSSEINTLIRLRYNAAITNRMRVSYPAKNQTFKIVAVLNVDSMNVEQHLMCSRNLVKMST